ncbi:C40 family peptidase [Caballeronia sordidicola]|uniref:Cell wall-associated hydrolases (Invasion-associated proteins) n=1 Tax=Caballeronia sordidicola TaxID=196367 RepID=A0A226XA39_CABSO|nr:C40 family peptidase [Caballeronia sordidicola]OXC80294.1 Cell wall-associated hydrolases (invasion-associated proteins) [Caballeronia sordidicola]
MRRLWSLLLLTLLVAACSSAPTRVSRAPAASNATASNRTFATPSGFPNFVDHSVGREEISIQAMSLVGVPYRWGGNTPEAGFDCSGLVRYVVDRAASVNLPRTTADMSVRGESIEPDEVAPGDLIFFNTTGRPHSHVGIYVGKLRFVNAPSTGGTVRLDYLTNPYWAKRFDGIRRVASPKAAPAPFDAPTYLASPVPVPVPADGASDRSPTQVAATVNGATTADRYEPPRAPPMTASPAGSYRTAAAAAAAGAGAGAGAGADQFEPPPPALSAAQRQAQSAGAVSPVVATARSGADPFEPPPSSLSAAQRQSQTANAISPPRESRAESQANSQAESNAVAAASNAPDPIAAAADAFEPPPPTARLAAQQVRSIQERQQAQQPSSVGRIPAADPSAHVMRASTNSLTPTRPATADDPIAKFATGSY